MILFNEALGPGGGPGKMQAGWPLIHPELRQLLESFDAFSRNEVLPSPVVTDLIRDLAGQVRIYTGHWRRLQVALLPSPRMGQIDPEGDGTWRPLTLSEQLDAAAVQGLSPAELEERARKKFTWHWVRCAADLRTRHYSRAQLVLVRSFFEKRCKRPEWEFEIHDVTAPHAHVGRRDPEWRKRFMP